MQELLNISCYIYTLWFVLAFEGSFVRVKEEGVHILLPYHDGGNVDISGITALEHLRGRGILPYDNSTSELCQDILFLFPSLLSIEQDVSSILDGTVPDSGENGAECIEMARVEVKKLLEASESLTVLRVT